MPDGFDIDPDRLSKAVPRFTAAGGDLAEALSTLQSALTGCAAMCGDDEQGREFAAAYDPAARTIAKASTFAARAVKQVGAAVQQMADNYEDLEQTNMRAARPHGGGR